MGGRGQASDPTVKIEENVIKVLNGDSDGDREVQLEMEQQRREQEYNNYKRYYYYYCIGRRNARGPASQRPYETDNRNGNNVRV